MPEAFPAEVERSRRSLNSCAALIHSDAEHTGSKTLAVESELVPAMLDQWLFGRRNKVRIAPIIMHFAV